MERALYRGVQKPVCGAGAGGNAFTRYLLSPLTSSLILTKGTGVPTLTRATTAYTVDDKGLKQAMPSGAARFPGLRVVRNLLTATEFVNGLADVTWTTDVSATTLTGYGGALQLKASTITSCAYKKYVTVIGRTYLFSVDIQMGDLSVPRPGTSNTNANIDFCFVLHSDLIISGYIGKSYLGNNIYRFFCKSTAPNANQNFGVISYAGNSGKTFKVTAYALYDVTNESNQVAREYISAGVLSTPYHGLGADGIKAFDYENPFTVDGNGVVTEGAHVPITGTKGMMFEPVSTNKCTCYGVPRADALGSELVVIGNPDFSSITGWINNGGLSSPFEIVAWQGAANTLHVKGPLNSGTSAGSIMVIGKVYNITARVWIVSGSMYFGIDQNKAGGIQTVTGQWINLSVPNYLCTNAGLRMYSNEVGSEWYIDSVSCKEAIDYPGTKAYHDGTAFQNPITGMTLSGNVAAVLSIVTDQTAIDAAIATEIAKGQSAWDEALLCALELSRDNGYKVYKLDNSLGSVTAYATMTGQPGNTNKHSLSTCVRSGTGAAIGVDFSNYVAPVTTTSQAYLRLKKEDSTPAYAAIYFLLGVPLGRIAYFLAPTLEELPFATSLNPSAGATSVRNADIFSYPVAGNLPNRGRRHIKFRWTPKAVIAGRDVVLAYSAKDASNFIKVASNGVIIYFQKRVAGVDEFVCYTITPVAGTTYAIDAWFNSDHTMGLKINGVSAGSGLGSELIVAEADRTFSSDTGWWTKNGVSVTIGGGVANIYTTGANANVTRHGLLTIGKGFRHTISQTVRADSLAMTDSGGPSLPASSGQYSGGFIATFGNLILKRATGALCDVDILDISIKEIYNSSTTLTPVLGTNLFIGSDGTTAINGQIKDFEIRS